MTTTPNFDDLTPPVALVLQWSECERPSIHIYRIVAQAARWGARHGWEQARQLWPEGNANAPTENDADEFGYVMAINVSGYWEARPWHSARDYGMKWLHTPRWQPRQPLPVDTLAAIIREVDGDHRLGAGALAEAILAHPAARRVLEQAGEGKA